MSKRRIGSRGFTLIELVIVIIVLGILAAVAVPKFVDMDRRARESQTRANLAAIRSAIAAFYTKSALSGTAEYPATQADIESCIQGGRIPTNMLVKHPLGNIYVTPNRAGFPAESGDYSDRGYDWFYESSSGQVWALNNVNW